MIKKIILFLSHLFRTCSLSYSRWKNYKSCPYLYYLLYIKNYKQPIIPQMSLGQSIHKALDLFHKNKYVQLYQLLEVYNDNWLHDGYKNPNEEIQFYEHGKRILEDFFNYFTKHPKNIVATELEFEKKYKNIIFKGVIDRIDKLDNGYEIIDYKTHTQPWTLQESKEDKQLILYSFIAESLFKWKIEKVTYFFVQSLKEISFEPTKELIDKTLEDFSKVAKEILLGNFNPNLDYCHSCLLQKQCKFGKKIGK